MSGNEPRFWLDIWPDAQGQSMARRTPLQQNLTRIGCADTDADVRLDALGKDQLHVWNHPPRVLHLGFGPKPTFAGTAFDERELAAGERVQWAGHTLLLGVEGAHAGDTSSAPAHGRSGAAPPRTAARERAGRRAPRDSSLGLGAFLVMQLGSFLLFALLVAAILVVLRIKGVSIDAFLDRFLP